jgi:hypothetical protein
MTAGCLLEIRKNFLMHIISSISLYYQLGMTFLGLFCVVILSRVIQCLCLSGMVTD